MTTHLTKTGTRAAANTSPEPFSNWILSFSEDALAVGLTYGAIRPPRLSRLRSQCPVNRDRAFSALIVRFVRRTVSQNRADLGFSKNTTHEKNRYHLRATEAQSPKAERPKRKVSYRCSVIRALLPEEVALP
jgi:hypothetical protein